MFARLPRIRGLSAPAQTVARELVRWREDVAATQDQPVQSILGDAALVELAKRKPSTSSQLEQIRGVGAASLHRRARELLDAVRRGEELPPLERPQDARPPASEPDDAPLVALAEALVRARAREAGLAYELLAARADLQAIVAAQRIGGEEADVRTLRGWRRELVGSGAAGAARRPRLVVGARGKLRVLRLTSAPNEYGFTIRCGCRLRTAAGTSRSR